MRRLMLGCGLVLLALAGLAPGAVAQENEADCGTQPDGRKLRAVLTFIEGRIKIDFRTKNSTQSIVGFVGVDRCTVDVNAISGVALPADGGDELPADSIIQGPEFLSRNNQLIMRAIIDPTKLSPGTYATTWSIGGDQALATSMKSLVTRSEPNITWPLVCAAVGFVLGFGGAALAAYVIARNAGGWEWKWPNRIALAIGLGLAFAATVQAYLTNYEDVLVWMPTVGNKWKLFLASFTAAAGGSVIGQLVRHSRSRPRRSAQQTLHCHRPLTSGMDSSPWQTRSRFATG